MAVGPLGADGYGVVVPDLRGARWSDAPAGVYRKQEMAGDLAHVLGILGVGPVKVACHDGGGPVAFCLLVDHPAPRAGTSG